MLNKRRSLKTPSQIDKKFEEELLRNKEVCIWMSFCDSDKSKGNQFLGVVITKALGFAHALKKAHSLGINPGGEVKSQSIDPDKIKIEYFDRLLSQKDLVEVGYIDRD